jgi:thiol-disulfide isomerase/thioredoxin
MQPEDPNQPSSEPPAPADSQQPEFDEQRLSRKGAWTAMGAVALALGLLWAAPSLTDDHTDEAGSAAGENAGDPEDAALTGRQAPLGFTLKDMHGADVALASFKGKIILLNFWATWCGPCKAEIPDLVKLQEQYPDDLVVLGFSVDDPVDKLQAYAAEYKMNYPVLVGNGRDDVQDAFGPLYGIPVSVIIGRDGRIMKKHSGIASKAQFEREIKALL